MGDRVERERRIALLLPVHFELVGRRVAGLSANVSRHGIYVRTDEILPIGDVIELGISLPSGRLIPISARVAHRLDEKMATRLGRFPGIGLAFIDRDTSALTTLANMIDHVGGEVCAPARSSNPPRILIAESDQRLLDRMTTILDDAGYMVENAANGVEAYALCLERRPDLVLCAERIPLMSGSAIATKLARDGFDIPMLFVEKPFTEGELCSRVEQAFAEHQSRQRPASLQVGLGDMSLGALLSFLEGARKTGLVTATRGNLKIELRVREGRIIDVTPTTRATAREQVLDLLDWIEGTFEFHARVVDGNGDIGCSISRLLLDHARLQDHLMEVTTAVRPGPMFR